jgi:hypothetical protein
MDDLKWFIGALFVLGLLWLTTGGPSRESSRSGPFLVPTVPRNIGARYSTRADKKDTVSIEDDTRTKTEAPAPDPAVSPFKGKVTLERANATRTNVDREYLRIRADTTNEARVLVTGWSIESVPTGKKVFITEAVPLPFLESRNFKEPIFLAPGETLYVVTGRSPNGLSFRTNLCSGYFEQFLNFTPRLDRECPHPIDSTLPAPPNALSDDCLDFIERMSRCTQEDKPPEKLGLTCRNYIITKISYQSCIDEHKNSETFYKDEWRVFLNHTNELWKDDREVLLLSDLEGKVVDRISY